MEAPFPNNKSFIYDGVGVAKLVQVFDGDTASFLIEDIKGNPRLISVRFLGINTPECTKKVEPFGKEALDFTKEKLENAKNIILEADSDKAELDNTHQRYLAYVWYGDDNQMRLLNLDLIEAGLAKPLIMNNVFKYNDAISKAANVIKAKGMGVYGELPSNFNSIMGDITVSDLVNNIEEYDCKTIRIEGIIVRTLSKSFFISDNNKGVYVYNTHYDISKLKVGDKVKFVAQFSVDNVYGAQLTNIRGLELIDQNCKVSIPEIYNFDDVNKYLGKVVKLKSFCVLKTPNYRRNAKTYFIEGIHGKNIIKIKVSDSIKTTIKESFFKKDMILDVIVGIISYRTSFLEEKEPLYVFCNYFEDDIEVIE